MAARTTKRETPPRTIAVDFPQEEVDRIVAAASLCGYGVHQWVQHAVRKALKDPGAVDND